MLLLGATFVVVNAAASRRHPTRTREPEAYAERPVLGALSSRAEARDLPSTLDKA